ncbi:MAG: TIGR00730 family Rossman fold protein [Thermoguttaceae bacterium]
MKRVCVFCGSSRGARSIYGVAAQQLGQALAKRGVGLVYGGGHLGLMGALADATMAAGGEVIGVIPQALVAKELAHAGVADMRIVGSMHERKALMADLSDAFITLPGGFGTLEEFFEVLSWAQLGLHGKPCGILNVAGFYDTLLAVFDQVVTEAFVRPAHRSLVLVESDPQSLLERLAAFQPPQLQKWIERDEV